MGWKSEYSAFSVVLYDENVPNNIIDNVKVVELDEKSIKIIQKRGKL